MPASDKYLPEQKANAVLWYTVCGDPKIVQHRFQDFYNHGVNHIDPPSADQIKEWYKNFRHLGFVDVQDAVVHEEATGEPMPHVENHSKIGSAVSTVLHKLNNLFLDGPSIRTFHPYHMELIKFDDVNDLEERKIFAKTQLEHICKWAPILRSMWFTGEAKFYTDGRVTCNNLIYTDTRKPDEKENLPHKVVKKYTHYDKPHITIWSAISSELVVGPIFFTGSISSEAYKQTLKNFVSDLHQISNENEHPLLVQDDSKLHSNAEVVEFLEKEFPNHWIGTESKYAKWPHHSSDLSPINFFLWGYIKSRVYKTPIEAGDVDELKKRIEAAFKNVTPDLLEEAIEEYKTRLERVAKTNGHLVDATIYGEEIDYDQLNVWGMYNWQYL